MDCFGARRSQLLLVYELVMSAVADSKKRNLEGQIGLFDMLDSEETAPQSVALPEVPELSAREMMNMEKETTGLYLSGHPMDGYRDRVKRAGAVAIGGILEAFGEEEDGAFQDGQSVTVAGVITKVKSKTTKNNSLMAYVTLEDDTGAMELLCFSRVLGQYGGCLSENTAVLVKGKISVRDEKEPQLMVDSAVPLEGADVPAPEEVPEAPTPEPEIKTLYLRLPTMGGNVDRRTRAILQMFPGRTQTVLFYADTRQRVGIGCLMDAMLIQELRELLGPENVVPK
jgi:DNA polymerase-3 subunit alpha